MNVSSYVFQTPYSSQVQVGKLDPNSQKDTGASSDLPSGTNQTQNEAKTFQASQTSEVEPSVESTKLDIYA